MMNFFKTMNSKMRGAELLKEIFLYCLNNGTSTVVEIAKALDYSPPAVSKHVIDLCHKGIFIDHGSMVEKEGKGRPPTIYGVNANSCFFVGVDIRFLSLNIGMVNIAGEVISMTTDKSFVFADTKEIFNYVCAHIREFIDTICAENKMVNRDKILNVNVNISGRVNPATGYSFSYFNTGEEPLSKVISDKIKYNVTIDNDTRAMTHGEYCHDSNGKPSNMICINMGYGVGMGIIINGEIYEGKSGYAGEFGHMSVFSNEILCHCGKKGCLETETSGAAFHREVIARIRSGSESVLSKHIAKNKKITIYDMIDAVIKTEDMLCIEILEDIGFKMGRQIANIINIFNPDKIVIGGLLASTGDYLLQPIKMNVHKYALTLVSKDTKIVISELQHKAGVYGACMLARDRVIKNQLYTPNN